VTLSLDVRLREGRYDAGGSRTGEAEWPPHPARVFCALAASADGPADWEALRWLECAGLPQVLAEATAVTTNSHVYVVTNRTEQDGGSQFWPGRTNQMRSRSSAIPTTDRFAIVWPDAVPAPGTLARLQRMARRIPYVGRVTSQAEVTVLAADPHSAKAWEMWAPAPIGSPGARDLRVPYQGYTDRLDEAFADGTRAWEVARAFPYAVAADATPDPASSREVHRTAWDDLVVWGFERGTARINGDQVVHIASMMRRAVLAVLGDTQVPVPSQVIGHGADGLPHVAFLALPDVGHWHADGHLLGIALAVPGTLPPDQWRHLMRTLLSPAFGSFTPWRARPIRLAYRANGRRGLIPEYWTGPDSGELSWVTVTPIATDGMPRKGRTYEELVQRSFRNLGYPELADIEVSPAPLTEGAIWRPRAGTLPPGRDHWPLVHARVTFDRPVRGPVLAGALRGLGLGLMIPVRSRGE
jgi:CRISPR-associated protein Csb2